MRLFLRLLALLAVIAATTTWAVADGAQGQRTEVAVLGARALFAPNADALSAAGEAALERLVERLADRHVGDDSIVAVRVVGHTDALGPADYNLTLSERRAAAVAAVLAGHHPDVPLFVEGAGESDPVASDATAEGRARNRRVEIVVVTSGPGAARPEEPDTAPGDGRR